MDEYALTGDLRDEEYGRYQDELNLYLQDVDRKQGLADNAYERGRDNWYTSYQMGVDADNTRYEREQYEAESAYGKQQDAYERLISLITTTGYTPSAQELQAAGMSQAQAKAYADYYTKQNTKVETPYQAPANPQPKPDPEPQPQPKPNIEKDLNDVIAGGATKSEINSALRDELKKGNITQAEYNRLKNQYAPRGYTY